MKKTYSGFVAIPEDVIEKWRTQISRSYIKMWSDPYWDTHPGRPENWNDPRRYATHGASGMDKFARKYIREQLKIPDSEVIVRCLRQKRIVRKIGNVWFFIVETKVRP